MVDPPSRTEWLFASLAGLTAVAGSYAAAGDSRSFVVAPIDALVVRATPGRIVAWAIQTLGESGHLLHLGLAVGLATALLGSLALVGKVAGRELDRPFVGVGLSALLVWLATTVITGAPVLALAPAVLAVIFTAVGTSIASASPEGQPGATESGPTRRRVTTALVGAIGFGAVAAAIGRFRSGSGPAKTGRAPGAGTAVDERLQLAEDRSLSIAGDSMPGLVSQIGEFYNVDIAQFDPRLSADDWSLSVTGDVEEEVTVDFDQLTAMPTEHRFVTLRCVGEDLNGRKMDTALWTGTPVKSLIEAAGPSGACNCAMVRAEDGYFVQYPLAALENGFIAWGMNGQVLPESHGHPVRILVPGHWGETNVKWLSEIEFLEEEMDGYWERRGWHGTGPVNTVAKLWSVQNVGNGHLQLAGHAYAGTRGIQRVEVSTDDGATWTDAELSEPLPGEDVWRQWRYEFEPDGEHAVVVRATDGQGTVQPRGRADAFPSGATGWVRQTVSL